jgi:hypothetical protein
MHCCIYVGWRYLFAIPTVKMYSARQPCNLALVRRRNSAKLFGKGKIRGFRMSHAKIRGTSNPVRTTGFCVAAGIATVLCAGGTFALVGTTPANAKPEFAAQTKLPCGQCHTNPAGGGKLKAFGEKFKATGNKL